MKKTHLLLIGAAGAILTLALFLAPPSRPSTPPDSQASAPDSGVPSTPRPVASQPESPSSKVDRDSEPSAGATGTSLAHNQTGQHCPHCQSAIPHPPESHRPLALSPDLFSTPRETGAPISFALPDGKTAVGTVERIAYDDDGRFVAIEGPLTAPAVGRFGFRQEPELTRSGQWVGAIRFPNEDYAYSLRDDGSGGPLLTYQAADNVSCVRFAPAPADPTDEPVAPEFLLPDEHPTDVPIPAYQNGVIPLESLPGAVGVAYLDFDGEEGPHENWPDFDAAPSGSSNTQIIEVWARVAEDFAPFNINVTTDLQVYLDAPETSRQRCIVTPTTDAAPGAGGVAFVGSWNWGGDTPCWAFYTAGKGSAEVISHELGHTLGLGHDGQEPDVGYYGGHGGGETGWAPIMGVGYYQNLTQWSKGEYTDANETQDDLVIIDSYNAVDFRADDHGNNAGAASLLELFGTTVNDDGVISTRTDVDVFAFTTTGGLLSLTINPVAAGPNLDISAEIRNDTNALVASSNPDGAVGASFSGLNLSAGTYTLHLDGVGRGAVLGDGYSDYASLGHYEIDGTIAGAIFPDRFDVDEFPPVGFVVGTPTPNNAHGANPLTFSITSGNIGGAFAIDPGTGQLTVANPAQFNFEALSSNWNDPAEFELFIQVVDGIQPSLNESLRVIVSVNDTAAQTPVILKHRYSFASDGSDSVGTADLTLVGAGTAVTGGALDLPGGPTRTHHAEAQGSSLTELATTVNTAVSITVEGWFNQDAAQNWAKLFMAGVNAVEDDYIGFTPRRGVDGNVSSISIQDNNDAETNAIGGPGGAPLTNNTEYYFAAVWDAPSNQLVLHIGPVGGTLEKFTGSMGGRSLADITIDHLFIGSAVFWPDPDFDGQVDELRFWSGAMSDTKVQANFLAGPEPAGDTDLDGLPDTWELSFPGISDLGDLDGNLSAGSGPGAGTGDFDGDGLSDFEEYNDGVNSTDPTDVDSDNDDYSDALERLEGSNPNNGSDIPESRLKHRYTFKIDGSDAIGTADLSTIGGASFTGGQLELPGGAHLTNHAATQGAATTQMADTITTAYALTIEAWFNQDTTNNWSKVMMTGTDATTIYMDLTPHRGDGSNLSSISMNDGGGENYVAGDPGGGSISNGVDYYCAGIWNPQTDQLTLHIGPVGGTLQTYTATMGGQLLADMDISQFRIGAAVYWGDPEFDGQVEEVRVWRGALTNAQVASHFAAGPVQPAGDLDGDGLPDEWELSFPGIDQLSDLSPTGDFDGDGLGDLDENAYGTNPNDSDSDGDGYSDGLEVALNSDPDDAGDTPTIPPTTLAHRYAFSADGSDSVGSADLTLVGAASITTGELDIPGGGPQTNHASAEGTALTEITGTIQSAVAITMEAWFDQDTAQNWSKVFMAGRGSGGEYLDITPRRGTSGNVSSISFNNGGTESTAIGSPGGSPLAVDTEYYCAAIWDPVADELVLHIGPVGGSLDTYTASLGGRTLTSVELNEFYLGSAVQFPDQDLDGQIDEFRIWRGRMSTSDISASFAAGPNAPPGDSDDDGLLDAWEFSFPGITHLDDLSDTGDFDGDGLTDAEEFSVSNTDPTESDSDGDGYSDSLENAFGSNPNDDEIIPVSPAASLAHRYSFSADASDSVGTAHLSLNGSGTTVAGGKLELPGSATPRVRNASASGAALTELATTINGNFGLSIETWFNQDTAQGWAKVFMAGLGAGGSHMDITPRMLVDDNFSSASLLAGGPAAAVIGGTSGSPLSNNVEYYLLAIWDGIEDEMTLRLGPTGGTLDTYTVPMNGQQLSDLAIDEFYLGSATFFGDPDFDGQIDEFRIWNSILTEAESDLHFALGPDALVPQPTIGEVSVNTGGGTISFSLSGLVPGADYYFRGGSDPDALAPLSGSGFAAPGTTTVVPLAIDPSWGGEFYFQLAPGTP